MDRIKATNRTAGPGNSPTSDSSRTLYFGLLCVFAYSIPLEGVFGVLELRSPPYYLGLACTAISLLFIGSIGRLFFKSPFLYMMLCVFLVGLAIDINEWHFYRDISFPFKLILMSVILLPAVADIRWRYTLLHSYMAGCITLCFVVLVFYSTGNLVMFEESRGMGNTTIRAERMLSLDPNEYSLVVLPAMLWCLDQILKGANLGRKWVFVVFNVAFLITLFMAVSRTGFILYAFSVVLLLYARWRTARKERTLGTALSIIMALSLASVIVVVIVLTGLFNTSMFVHSMQVRMDGTIRLQEYGGRDRLSAKTLDVILREPLGVGLNSAFMYLDGRDPHNDYLMVIAESGIVGTIFLMIGLYVLLKNVYQYYRRKEELWLVISVLMYLVATAVFQGFSKRAFFFIYTFFALSPLIFEKTRRLAHVGKPANNTYQPTTVAR